MKNNLIKRIFASLLSLVVLFGTFSVLPFSALAETTSFAASAGKVKISLSWADHDSNSDGVTDIEATAKKSYINAEITADGPANQTVQVVLSAFALSAVGSEFESKGVDVVKLTTDQNGKASGTVRYDLSTATTPYTQLLNATTDYTYRHQIAVQIVSLSDNAIMHEDSPKTLRAHIDEDNGALVLTATSNQTMPYFYDILDEGNLPGAISNGYTYWAVHDVQKTWMDHTFIADKEAATYEKNSNGVYRFYDYSGSITVPSSKLDYKTTPLERLYSIKNPNLNNNQHKILLDNYCDPEASVYVSTTMWLNKGINGDKFTYLGYGANVGDKQVYNFPVSSISYDGSGRWLEIGSEELWMKVPSVISNSGSLSYHSSYVLAGSNPYSLTFKCGDENALSDALGDAYIGDIRTSVMIIDQTSPKIEAITVANPLGENGQPKVYRDGDEIYVAVKMSKAVQLGDTAQTDKLILRLKIEGTDTVIPFYYVDGNYTDTLIFKAEYETRNEIKSDNFYFESLGFEGGSSKYCNRIADLFLNTYSVNNAAELSYPKDKKIPCAIDERKPNVLNKNAIDEPVKDLSLEIFVDNVGEGAMLYYMWSQEIDDLKTLLSETGKWSSVAITPHGTDNSMSATVKSKDGLNGYHYLHVAVKTASGVVVRETVGVSDTQPNKYLFDNIGPEISFTSGSGSFTKYQTEHKMRFDIVDTLKHAEVSNVYYRVEDINGDPMAKLSDVNGYVSDSASKLFGYVHAYGEGSGQYMTKVADAGAKPTDKAIFEINMTHVLAAIPESTYGKYKIYIKAVDALGNISDDFIVSPVMFDNRTTFPIEFTASYGEEAGEAADDEFSKMLGFPIYYNEKKIGDVNEPLVLTVVSKEPSPDDYFALYYVASDDQVLYDARETKDPIDYMHCGLLEAPKITVTPEGYMNAVLKFSPDAIGRYDIGFLREGSAPSAIISVYISPNDADTPNYTSFYDEERLLINSVYKFSTGTFYNQNQTTMKGYDGTDLKTAPIFSSAEKALEYT